jgi:hypothetical protein
MSNLEFLLSGRKVAAFFNDPGGAKIILSILERYNKNIKSIKIFTSRDYSFIDDFNINSSVERCRFDVKEDDIRGVDLILTGTSLPANTELMAISAAKVKGINTLSIVDRRQNFIERFKMLKETIIPDHIFAVEELNFILPSEFKRVFNGYTPNYYYRHLREFQPNLSRASLLSRFGIEAHERYFLYAPEPISAFNLQNEYGFDEVSGLGNCIDSLIDCPFESCKVIIVPHPNQNSDSFKEILNRSTSCVSVYLSKNISINSLMFYAEAVISYNSSVIGEAIAMGRPVIRPLWFSNKKSKLMLDLNSQQGAFNCDTKVLFQNKITSLIQ